MSADAERDRNCNRPVDDAEVFASDAVDFLPPEEIEQAPKAA
jgi:hypothetical protein